MRTNRHSRRADAPRSIASIVMLVAACGSPAPAPVEAQDDVHDTSAQLATAAQPDRRTTKHTWTLVGDETLLLGQIRFEMKGARQLRGHGPVVACDSFGFHADSRDFTAAKGARNWELRGEERLPADLDEPFSVSLSTDDGVPGMGLEWRGELPKRPRADFSGRSVFDVELRDQELATRTISLHVELTCPDPYLSPRVTEELGESLALWTGVPVRSYAVADTKGTRDPRWRSVVLPEERVTWPLVAAIRARLPPGFTAFQGPRQPDEGTQLVLARVMHPADLLRIARTTAGRYGIQTEGLILRLRPFLEQDGMVVFGAEQDAIRVVFQQSPTPGTVLAQELLAVCPDILDGEHRSLAALARAIEDGEPIVLRWD